MGLHLNHGKLLPEICRLICHGKESAGSCSSDTDCSLCFKICLINPQYPYYPPPLPPQVVPPSFYTDEDEHHHDKITTCLILGLALLAAAFFAVCCRAIYTRFSSRRRASTSSTQQQREETRDDFLDEEHGPIVDHPIWYIRTLGLHQSVINAITVCNYKKGEGLIEGAECSVCLSEFEEDESLRLLPKCHHAFHLHCIDTWLASHTNCPNCRAPIVTNPATALESNVVDSGSLEHARVEILENSGETETSRGLENSASDSRVEEEGQFEVEDGTRVGSVSIRPRRSVSMDDSFVANINLALATVLSEESNGNSNRVLEGVSVNEPTVSKVTAAGNEDLPTASKGSSSFRSTRDLQGVPSSMKRSRSYNGKYLLSWYSRSQKKPNALSSEKRLISLTS